MNSQEKCSLIPQGSCFALSAEKSCPLKLSIIKSHVESAKYARNKQQLKEKHSREHDITQAFKV